MTARIAIDVFASLSTLDHVDCDALAEVAT
jgi:hypothetical protein